ncbi:MAG: CDP-paratose 2-epimerase [Candidatus Methylomirabilales bacterium]
MSRVGAYTLHRRQRVALDLDETFAFFEQPEHLAQITPPWLDFRLLTPLPIVMAPGLTLDYTIRVLGRRVRCRSLIRDYQPPHRFRDTQLLGPYRWWDHLHQFWREGSSTVVEDLVTYELPFGLVGSLGHRLLVRRRLEAIFDYRRDRLAALLSPRR